jgi:ABC-type nitrate/sulfonate/bicarbonate transport system substrate-binding protein
MEKVLLITQRLSEARPAEHAALIAALSAAAEWCDNPAHVPELAQLLGGASYLNLPARALMPALTGEFECGHRRVEHARDFLVFHRHGANVPSADKALALQTELSAAGLLPAGVDPQLPRHLFREDIYRSALNLEPPRDTISSIDLRGVAR